MIRLLLEDRLEDGRGLELVRVGLVVRVEGDVERERVEDGRFAVLRIARRQGLHGLLVGLRARAMIDLLVVLVEDLDGGDVVDLTLGLGRPCSWRGPRWRRPARRSWRAAVPASGLPSHATAAPQAAIPHEGSAFAAASNPVIAYWNQKECSRATARVNSFWAAGLHDVGKFTEPSFSADS